MAEPTTTTKKIVILGGSYAGVSTAHYLLKHLIPHLPTHQIVLVSPSLQTMCRPACPRALLSDAMFPQEKLFVNIPQLFEQYPSGSFSFIHGSATGLDHVNRVVTINGEAKISFDAVVIATGTSTQSPLMGFNNQDAEALKGKWVEFRKGLEGVKSIVIAGGGPVGVETAGELGEMLNGRGNKNTSAPKVAITVVTSGTEILPILRPSIATKAEALLADVGVKVVKNMKVVSVSPEGAGTVDVASAAKVTLADGTILEADLYIPAVGVTYNTGFVDKSLLTAEGRLNTNSSTLRVDVAGPKVYALGDVSSAARPAVHNIFNTLPVVCGNIKRDLLLESGKGESEVGKERTFVEDKREMQLVPIGRSKGVGAAMGWQLPSLMVWAIKGRDYWLWTTGGLWSGKQWNKES